MTTTRVTMAQLRDYYPRQRISTYILPLPDHALVYVKNPKAACSTLLVWLDRLHTGELDHQFSNVHKQHRLPRVGQVGRSRVRAMLDGEAYRFSFVRHPLRRLESVYWDKLVHAARAPVYRGEVQQALGVAQDPHAVPTFEEFLSAIEQQHPVREMNPHWRPQHVNLLHPVVTYDYVGRVESFADDLARIRDEAKLPQVPLQVRNITRHTTGDSVYDGRPDLVRRVERVYARDLELYGY
ncbi:MAG: sulfotransferase family protein [Nocardioidaceae bacterium]